jgi:voltage-gated potassium channel
MGADADYKKIQRQFRIGAAVSALVLAGGATFYHYVEHFSWLDAFYFCTITLTTIGYGDIVPTTPAGKIFTMLYALVGIGILAAFGSLLVHHAVARRQLKTEEREKRDAT